MANILFLIDNEANEFEEANNWIVYPDNISKVLNEMLISHNESDSDATEWEVEEAEILNKFVQTFYTEGKIEETEEFKRLKVSYKIFDDEIVSIPIKSKSYLFIFNDGEKDFDYKVIEEQIAGYAIRLTFEDMEYTSCEYRGYTYHGEDFGYNLTDHADECTQKVVFHYDWKPDVFVYCYKLYNCVEHDS